MLQKLQNERKWNEWILRTHIKPLMFAATDRQTDRHRRTDTRPWSILWPDGDLTAQQLLTVWCFTLRITFHFQTPQPIRGRQGRQWQRDATLALLILHHAAPPNRHHRAYPSNTPLASHKTHPLPRQSFKMCVFKPLCIKKSVVCIYMSTKPIHAVCTHHRLLVRGWFTMQGLVCTSRVNWKWCIKKVYVFACVCSRWRQAGLRTLWPDDIKSSHNSMLNSALCCHTRATAIFIWRPL